MEGDEIYWDDADRVYRRGYYGFRLDQETVERNVRISSSNGAQAKLEVVLQKFLKCLGAFADNFDRIVRSFETHSDGETVNGWLRLLQSLVYRVKTRFGAFDSKFMPNDRKNSLWVYSFLVVLFCFAITGFRLNLELSRTGEEENTIPVAPAKKILLPDGRNVAYREQGVAAEQATYSVLIVHGFLSSRLAGIPGVNNSMLESYGIRLIAYDLPGFGESDVHPERNYSTSAKDMENIADALGLSQSFWLFAYSEGCPHAWAAIKYIPQRLAGVVLIAPAANPYGGNLTSEESGGIWRTISFRRRWLYTIAKRFPSILKPFIQKTLLHKIERIKKSIYATVGKKDYALFEQESFVRLWEEDVNESMKQENSVAFEQELLLLVNDWGFNLGEFTLTSLKTRGFLNQLRSFLWTEEEEVVVPLEGFRKPIHIWQGTEDTMIPVTMSDFVVRILPHVKLHTLEGEGHFSWFYLCDECHRNLFESLFEERKTTEEDEEEEEIQNQDSGTQLQLVNYQSDSYNEL